MQLFHKLFRKTNWIDHVQYRYSRFYEVPMDGTMFVKTSTGLECVNTEIVSRMEAIRRGLKVDSLRPSNYGGAVTATITTKDGEKTSYRLFMRPDEKLKKKFHRKIALGKAMKKYWKNHKADMYFESLFQKEVKEESKLDEDRARARMIPA